MSDFINTTFPRKDVIFCLELLFIYKSHIGEEAPACRQPFG